MSLQSRLSKLEQETAEKVKQILFVDQDKQDPHVYHANGETYDRVGLDKLGESRFLIIACRHPRVSKPF